MFNYFIPEIFIVI